MVWRPGGLFDSTATLRALIQYAYGLQLFERVEGSHSVLDEQFIILGRLDGPLVAARVESREAVRQLLAERFNLRVRLEEEVQRVALLRRISPDHLGPGIRLTATDCSRALTEGEQRARQQKLEKGEPIEPLCDGVSLINGRLHAIVSSMARLATALSWYMQAAVVDDTALTDGPYELDITFDPATVVTGSRAMEELPPFDVVLRTELGMKLETERRPVRVLIVEHVDRPEPN